MCLNMTALINSCELSPSEENNFRECMVNKRGEDSQYMLLLIYAVT